MKAKILAIITLLILLFAPFAQARVLVPEKIIASNTVVVERFYNHNINYKTQYTIPNFNKKVCSINPKRFKKCSDYEFRHQQKGLMYYPALPKVKEGKMVKWIYTHNEIYRILFPTITKFKNEVCKNNPEITEKGAECAVKNIKTTINLKITDRPKTYIIPGENTDSITVDEKIFIKSKKGEYYNLTEQTTVTNVTKKTTGEIKILEEVVKRGLPQNQHPETNESQTGCIQKTEEMWLLGVTTKTFPRQHANKPVGH